MTSNEENEETLETCNRVSSDLEGKQTSFVEVYNQKHDAFEGAFDIKGLKTTDRSDYISDNLSTMESVGVIVSSINEKTINPNKPWRKTIKRRVADGRGYYQDISGSDTSNQPM